MDIKLKQLKYFIVTAETGRISLAAKSFYVSQSTITYSIQVLESQIGQSLFIRTSKGVTLTEFGTQFLPKAKTMLTMLEEIEDAAKSYHNIVGRLKLAVTYTVMGYFITPHIKRLKTLYPNLSIDIFEMTRVEAEQALLQQDIDMAILLTSNSNNPKIKTETFLNSDRRLWVSSTHPLLKSNAVYLSDLLSFPYVMLNVDESYKSSLRYWHKNHINPNIWLKTSSIEAIRSLVGNGDAITILSDMVYRPWSLEGRQIETIILQDTIDPMSIGLAYITGTENSIEATTLRGYFSQQFKNPIYR